MSQENVELARRASEAWNAEGFDSLLPFFPEDVVWYPFPEWPEGPEPRRGHDGVRELMNAWDDNFDEWAPIVNGVHDLGDCVVVLGEMVGRIKGSGMPIRQSLGWVCSDFRDNQIGEIRFFLTEEEAFKAAELSQ